MANVYVLRVGIISPDKTFSPHPESMLIRQVLSVPLSRWYQPNRF